MVDVESLSADAPALNLVEQKTSKKRKIAVNSVALKVMRRRLADNPQHKYLFQSQASNINRRSQQAINRRSVCRVFEKAGNNIAPRVAMGTHSMRKTRGYAMHEAGKSIESICKVLNHSTPAVTLRYIGIDQHDIDQSYFEFEL